VSELTVPRPKLLDLSNALVLISCKADEALFVYVESQRVDTRDGHVDSEVEFQVLLDFEVGVV